MERPATATIDLAEAQRLLGIQSRARTRRLLDQQGILVHGSRGRGHKSYIPSDQFVMLQNSVAAGRVKI